MYGPDVSNNNGSIDYRSFLKAKPAVVGVKRSEGTWFVDRYADATRAACLSAGVPAILYHFGRPDRGTSPTGEADYFCKHVGELRAGEGRPCLDLEVGTPSRKWAEAWCARVESKLGVRPLVYTYPWYLERLGGWAAGDLWIANLVTPGHSRILNVLQQYSWHAHWPGVAGDVDMNYTDNVRALLAHPTPELTDDQLFWLWWRWRLGEGEFHGHGAHNPTIRPKELPERVPARWWIRGKLFLAARNRHKPAPKHPDHAARAAGRASEAPRLAPKPPSRKPTAPVAAAEPPKRGTSRTTQKRRQRPAQRG